jgi:hypothetical protein
MTLEKPKDEECGNCYYCVSKWLEREREEATGLFSSKTVHESKEVFWCRRNAPSPVMISTGTISYTVNVVTRPLCKEGVPVDPDYWCGEYRRRE